MKTDKQIEKEADLWFRIGLIGLVIVCGSGIATGLLINLGLLAIISAFIIIVTGISIEWTGFGLFVIYLGSTALPAAVMYNFYGWAYNALTEGRQSYIEHQKERMEFLKFQKKRRRK